MLADARPPCPQSEREPADNSDEIAGRMCPKIDQEWHLMLARNCLLQPRIQPDGSTGSQNPADASSYYRGGGHYGKQQQHRPLEVRRFQLRTLPRTRGKCEQQA